MMKKIALTVGLSLIAGGILSVVSATSSFNGWTNSYVSSLSSSAMGSIGCDVTTYTQVYSGFGGVILDYFTNTSAGPDYLWKYSSYTYGNHFLYNPSTNHTNGNVGIMIFNRDKLNAIGWKVPAGHTVRHMTTAEEVSNSTFAYSWSFPAYSSIVSNDFGSFTFHTPNYRNNGSHPTTPSVGSAYDAEVRIATFYDGDNNASTTTDNRGELECERLQVRWCGDGILDTARGEVCDHGLSNGQPGDTCSLSCQTVILPPVKADLSIVKTVTGSTVQGGTVVYKISFSNAGPGNATGVIVTDILGTGMDYVSASITPASVVNNSNGTTTVIFNVGTVNASANGIITMTTKIKTTALNCMTVQNNVSIATVTPELSLTNNASAAYFQVDCAPVKPDLTVVKTVTGSTAQSGTVVYKIAYSNIGSGDATGVIVTDILGTGMDYVSASITPTSVAYNPDGTTTVKFNVGTVTAHSNGIITMTTRIKPTAMSCMTVQNNVSIATVTPELSLTNNASAAYFQVDCIPVLLQPDLAIVKTVTGSTVQSGAVVYKITFNNIGSGSATGVIVTDVLGTGMDYVSASITPTSVVVNSNGTTTVTFNIGTVAAYAGGIITINAKIKGNTPNCVTLQNGVSIVTTNDLTLTNNTSMATFQMQCPTNPNLWLQKDVIASTGGYVPNGYAIYTIAFGNSGSGTATGVIVTDTLPADLTYVSSVPPASTVSGNALTWNIGTLAPGQQGVIKITVRLKSTVPVCQNHIVDNIGKVTATNATGAQDNATFLVLCFDLYANKIIDKPLVVSGDIVTYTINYGNSGQLSAPNWSLVDALPTGVQYVSGSITILSGINIGQPILTGNPVSGQVLTWTGFTNMAPGYSGLVSIQAQILGPTTSGHVYTNVVCIEGDNNYNNNNCGKVITTVTGTTTTPFFDLNLVKSIDKSTADNGETVTYTIVVTNESDVTATVNGYTVQDYLPAGVDYLGNPTGPSGMNLTLSGTKDITFYNLPQLKPGDRFTITFQGTYRSTVTETNYAEICSYIGVSATSGIKDRDSNPCNRGRAQGVEDDESQASVGPKTGCVNCGGGGGGGGGGGNPYCGDGIVRVGEQCDPGNAALGIKPSGVLSGQVCLPNCTLMTGTKITAGVKCSYIDPPAINVGEYMPYWWDMEYGYNTIGTGRTLATSFCTKNTGDIRIYTPSLQCHFELKGPNGHVSSWDLPCYTNPHLSLIDTAFSAAKIKYNMDIFPGGAAAILITGSNYLGLGEYMITMKVVGGKQCNGTPLQPFDRICQMNFGVTKQYAVARTVRGTFASTPDLPTYGRQDGTPVLNVTDAINALKPFILDITNRTIISQMINKYVSLAVKADVITDKLPDNTTIQKAIVSKVPSKNIFVIDAKTPEGKKGMITVSDKATYQGGAFTLIVINGDLVVKGDMKQNSNGMFIVRDGDLIFSAEGDAKTNNQNQEVKGIFIGLGSVWAEGDGQPAFNNDLNKPWINGGRLVIDGILLGADVSKLVAGRRSVVEDWFDRRAGDGLLEDGSIVIKANPDMFTHLPPAAEDISTTLNVFKK